MNTHIISGAFPLSPMQQGMLFHHVKEPRSGVDIEQLVVHLPEAADAARMRAAWQWLCGRHEILCTQFVWNRGGEPQQEVLPRVSLPFVVVEGHAASEGARAEQLQSFLQTDRVHGFDLDRAPLLRVTLFQWNHTSSSLVWTFHHALLDGRTFPTLLREVFDAYAELRTGNIAERPAPPAYRRYIEWLQTRDFTAADAFWKEYLKGLTAPTPIVVDHVAEASAGASRQGEAWEKLESATTARLRALVAQHAVTMNSFVQAAWGILLHRYSDETDIVFGATRACRKSAVPGADEMIGLFINTVPVRVKVTSDASALSVVKAARQQWLALRPYEHSPLVRVKAASELPAAQSLFETLVVFENYRLDTAMRAMGGDWTARRVDLHELTNFPVTLAAYDGEELSFKIEFDQRRLDRETVDRMLGHLRRLLEGIAANELTTVAELPLLAEVEKRELLRGLATGNRRVASHLPADGGATLHECFEAQVARRPDAVALTCESETLTYAQLNARANRIARELVKQGVGPDTLVGLCLDRTNDLVAALIGILKSGGAYVPIDAAYPAERTAFILEDAQAPVLLTERKLAATMPVTKARVICMDEYLEHPATGGDEQNLSRTSGPENVAYVIYTSGTTGRPKGSLITHRNVMRLFPSTEHWYQFNERDVWTLFHSSAFDFSVWEIWGALLYGGRVVVVPYLVSRSPEAFYELLARERVTILNQTPSAFRQLMQAEESAGQKELALRFVIFGGEALEMQSLRPWFGRHGDEQPRLVNMYGITETTVHVTYRPLSKNDLNSGSVIGVPISDLQIYILDSQKQLVPRGVPGEVYVGGAGLAKGYLRRPDLTAQRFLPNHLSENAQGRLYRTGDRARFLPGGDIEYLGRVDEQVKIRGFRIELGEIESVLCEHPAVRGAAVMTREDASGSKHLVAYVVSSGETLDATALRAHLKKKLPDYMIPSVFVSLASLPLTNHGKVDRKALPAPEVSTRAQSAAHVPPQTDMERNIAEIWKALLNVEQVSVEENFFDLGGHSLLLVQLHARLREKLQAQFPMVALFEHSTIRALAQYLDEPVAAGVAADRGLQDRAARQKEALAGFRNRLKKDGR